MEGQPNEVQRIEQLRVWPEEEKVLEAGAGPIVKHGTPSVGNDQLVRRGPTANVASPRPRPARIHCDICRQPVPKYCVTLND